MKKIHVNPVGTLPRDVKLEKLCNTLNSLQEEYEFIVMDEIYLEDFTVFTRQSLFNLLGEGENNVYCNIILTNYPFIDNFFTWTEDTDKIGITLWQIEEIYLHAEKDVYDYILFSISTELTWLELKRNAIKTKPNIHFSNLFHRETRGCPFDLCAYKLDKIKKLSNPVLCSKCRRKLDEWKVSTELLSNVIEYLKEYKLSDIYYEGRDADTVFKILQILGMLGNCSREYLRRKKNNEVVKIKNEKDLQDFLFILMKPTFPDIKSEVYCPPVGIVGRIPDFVFPKTNVILETKFVRDEKHAKKVLEEVMIDIESFYVYPNCKIMIFYIFDPSRFITDPGVWETDLNGIRQIRDRTFEVRVVIEN